jgi:hypothetical protein
MLRRSTRRPCCVNGIARKIVAFAQSAILDVNQRDLLTLTIVGKHSISKPPVAGATRFGLTESNVTSLDLGKKMAAACEAKAKEMSWKMNISIVDSGASEIFFERMDGAYLGSGDIARHKAETSARFPFPTRASSN